MQEARYDGMWDGRLQITNPKIQITSNDRNSNSFGHWNLELIWNLEIVI